MASRFYRGLHWLAWRVAVSILILAGGLVAYAVLLLTLERPDFAARRADVLAELTAVREASGAERDAAWVERTREEAELALHQDRATRARRVITRLDELDSLWERWFGNRAQQLANDENREKMRVLERAELAMVRELERDLARTRVQADRLSARATRAEQRLVAATAAEGPWTFYTWRAWDQARWYLAAAVLVYVVGTPLLRLVCFYAVAPRIAAGRPVKLTPEPALAAALPELGECGRRVEVALWPGERLLVRDRFIVEQAAQLTRRHRALLTWRFPFGSVASGWSGATELHHAHVGGVREITLAPPDDLAAEELALVTLPERCTLIVRPSHLAGVIVPPDVRLTWRRRWRIFAWEAWVAGRFAYLEVSFVRVERATESSSRARLVHPAGEARQAFGPGRLILCGGAATVRAWRLQEREGAAAPQRRVELGEVIAFSPTLALRPARVERLFRYLGGGVPLFDETFAGTGVVLARGATRRRAGFRASLRRVFGF